jgi:hypothetical protein
MGICWSSGAQAGNRSAAAPASHRVARLNSSRIATMAFHNSPKGNCNDQYMTGRIKVIGKQDRLAELR